MRKSVAGALTGCCVAALAGCVFISAGESFADERGLDGAASSNASVVVTDFIGVINVTTRPGAQFSADLVPGKAVSAGAIERPDVDVSRNGVAVHGEDPVRIKNCRTKNDKLHIKVKGDKLRPLSDFPVLNITAPTSADMSIEMSGGEAEIGDTKAVTFKLNGCGDVELGNVADLLKIGIHGSGDIVGGDAGVARVSIHGSGDVELEDVAGDADISIHGSGDVEMGDVDGNVDASIHGSGDIDVAGGDHRKTKVSIHGSGDVDVGGVTGNLSANIHGSGDIETGPVTGEVSGGPHGSGDLTVDGKSIKSKHGRWIWYGEKSPL